MPPTFSSIAPPAISGDGNTIYVAIKKQGGGGYLCGP